MPCLIARFLAIRRSQRLDRAIGVVERLCDALLLGGRVGNSTEKRLHAADVARFD